jgi:hypothetical protein
MNNNQLNAFANLIGSSDKGQTLVLAIAYAIKAGADIETAFDVVVGKGSYQKFAGEIYDSIRNR